MSVSAVVQDIDGIDGAVVAVPANASAADIEEIDDQVAVPANARTTDIEEIDDQHEVAAHAPNPWTAASHVA